VVYGSLTAMLVTLYFGGIVVLQRLFVIITGQKSTLAVVASTLAIAACLSRCVAGCRVRGPQVLSQEVRREEDT
jgi:hypothetical protein